MSKASISDFLDKDGKVLVWPAKHSNKFAVVEYLATKFDPSEVYHERKVNEILKQWHMFSDWPLLRRSLVDYGFLGRNTSGTEYRVVHR